MPTALITGGSRGVGAATAVTLAAHGWDVHLTYRDKAARADAVVETIRSDGGRATAHRLDVTDPAAITSVLAALPGLDVLILNASGGMEADKPADYATLLNRDAQVAMVEAATPLLQASSAPRVVFVTSHEAHFYGVDSRLGPYVQVAASKRAGEDALRALLGAPEPSVLWLDDPAEALPAAQPSGPTSVPFVVVSGDMITGTATATLLERARPGTTAQRLQTVGSLPSTEDFGRLVARCADAPLPHGVTVCLGGRDYADGGPSPFAHV